MLDKTDRINTYLLNHGQIYNKIKLALGGYQMKFYKYTGYCQGTRKKELHGFFMKTQMEYQTGWEVITS